MKRDMGLIRRILLSVESWPPEGGDVEFKELGRDEDEIQYNIGQAHAAGLLDCNIHEAETRFFFVEGLTPRGHDFLEETGSP